MNSQQSFQCKAKTALNRQCLNKTKNSEFCWIHLQQLHNVHIKKSKIPQAQRGLFTAKKALAKNQNVVEYTGTRTNVLPQNTDYALEIKKHAYINGNRRQDIGGLVNDCRWSDKRAKLCKGVNCKFQIDRNTAKVFVKTIKKVPANEELYVSYGPQYWRQKKATESTIKSG